MSVRGLVAVVVLLVFAVIVAQVWSMNNLRLAVLQYKADMEFDHRMIRKDLAINGCIQTLTPGERKALRFNRNSPWKAWCWWLEEPDTTRQIQE